MIYEHLIKKLNNRPKRGLSQKNPKTNKLQTTQHTDNNLQVMKKRLEADLISIAHRILQLKNKSDINLLYLETQKLYEKLAVLRFIDTHFGDAKPTIGYADIEKEVENFFDKDAKLPVETTIEMKETFSAVKDTTEEKTEEPIAAEPATSENTASAIKEEESTTPEAIEEEADEFTEEESAGDDFTETEEIPEESVEKEITKPSFKAAFELSEEVEIETPKKPEAVQISFDDLLGADYTEPLFVKVDEVTETPSEVVFETANSTAPIEKIEEAEEKKEEKPVETETSKNITLNEKLSKGIDIDLNDRIAFVKHLFGNSNEDYNRVMSQILTFDNFYETKSFIEEMVKPDYNNWEGKDDYEERFMEIIEKKFL